MKEMECRYVTRKRSQHIKWNELNDLKITKIKITVTEEDVAPSEDTNVNMNTRQLIWEDNNNMIR